MSVDPSRQPREMIRIERDYAAGEALPQFWSGYPPELQGRVRLVHYECAEVRLTLGAHEDYSYAACQTDQRPECFTCHC